MRIGIFSDIHGNLPALQAVLDHMNTQGVETKVCLGDIVGYGAFPNECVETVVSNCKFIVRGNHDDACVDLKQALGFNPLAREAIEWTAKHTTASNKDFLRNLEYGYLTEDGIMFIHGSPKYPFAYIFNDSDADSAFAAEEFNIAFVGHTHIPMVWGNKGDSYKPLMHGGDTYTTALNDDERYIVNVGSVGQPRDNDSRASYVLYDTETKELVFHRVSYPIERAVSRMQQASLPAPLWQRLLVGR